MVHIDLFHQRNPLIDECSNDTLANMQAMLGRIQVLHIDHQQTLKHKAVYRKPLYTENSDTKEDFCPAEALYIRLLQLVKEAIEHEIDKTIGNDPDVEDI